MCVPDPAVLILVVKQGDARQREVALPLSEFQEGPVPVLGPERQVELGNDLVPLPHRGQRAGEKLPGADRARSGSTDQSDLGLAGHRDARQFRSGIGMSKAAADCAAVADLIMRDMGDRLTQQRMRDLQPAIVLDVAPTYSGAEADAAVANTNRV